MICKVFVFRHAETFDNCRGIFSGWRDSNLTQKGLEQAQKVAEQLKYYQIDFAFTSHLKRARKTLEHVLKFHPSIPVYVDDRIIERCYGVLQGRSKKRLEHENPGLYAMIHRGYEIPPPKGESLKMVESRVLSFLKQLNAWLVQTPGNVVISCHGNSMRPIRKVFENLSLAQMLQLENPHDLALIYDLQLGNSRSENQKESLQDWKGMLVPPKVKLAVDPLNPLREIY
jgi:2,3-bisphosphoglycerate-dependent phosphoglycerate mutase